MNFIKKMAIFGPPGDPLGDPLVTGPPGADLAGVPKTLIFGHFFMLLFVFILHLDERTTSKMFESSEKAFECALNPGSAPPRSGSFSRPLRARPFPGSHVGPSL